MTYEVMSTKILSAIYLQHQYNCSSVITSRQETKIGLQEHHSTVRTS